MQATNIHAKQFTVLRPYISLHISRKYAKTGGGVRDGRVRDANKGGDNYSLCMTGTALVWRGSERVQTEKAQMWAEERWWTNRENNAKVESKWKQKVRNTKEAVTDVAKAYMREGFLVGACQGTSFVYIKYIVEARQHSLFKTSVTVGVCAPRKSRPWTEPRCECGVGEVIIWLLVMYSVKKEIREKNQCILTASGQGIFFYWFVYFFYFPARMHR